jgi:hypothetical protein
MTRGVNADLAGRNADALERALDAGRSTLELLESDERERRAQALGHIEGYMALLREPAPAHLFRSPVRYSFKLVFPDGRWAIDEKQLVDRPTEGDLVVFDRFGGWRIEGEQHVGVKPSGKAPREFFVCAPAA